jgi:hypothetical protein
MILAAVGTLTAAEPLKMNPVPAETLQFATSGGNVYQMRFRYDLKGGAQTNAGNALGRLLVQSLASYLGDHSADDESSRSSDPPSLNCIALAILSIPPLSSSISS